MTDFLASGPQVLSAAIWAGYAMLVIALGCAMLRLLHGPTIADRVVALDFIALLAMGLVALFALDTGRYAFLDVAIALGLVSFLATVAYARFVVRRAIAEEQRTRDTGKPGESMQ